MAEELRRQGNEAFQSGDLSNAISFYTYFPLLVTFPFSLFTPSRRSLKVDSNDFLSLSNRSLAYYKKHMFDKALADADRCIAVHRGFGKVCFSSRGWQPHAHLVASCRGIIAGLSLLLRSAAMKMPVKQ